MKRATVFAAVGAGVAGALAAATLLHGLLAAPAAHRAGRPAAAGSATPAPATSGPAATAGPTAPSGRARLSAAAPAPSGSAPPAAAGAPRLLFGIGTEATGARQTRLVRQAPARMLTSWYNGPDDLTWMTGWRTGTVPGAYAAGYALHLIVYTNSPEQAVDTSYGPACGRTYPLSDRFLADMRALATTFAGTAGGPPLYVTLFTEVQTYACTDNAWNPDPGTNAYYRALKDRYLAALAIFHQTARNAKVSLGWGGWLARTDAPATGGGRSMLGYFADVLQASDFQSVQAMQGDGNAGDVTAMVRALGRYGRVMLAHYKPDNGSQATFDRDVRTMLTDGYLRDAVAAGLFAWSFMDERNLAASSATYQFVLSAVARFGADPKG